MRLAQVSDCYLPTVNGVCISIQKLVRGLAAKGEEVALLTPSIAKNSDLLSSQFKDECAPNLEHWRFSSWVVPQMANNHFSWPWPLANWSRLKRFKPQVVHIHTPGNLGLYAYLWAKAQGLPYIFTHHTLFDEYLSYSPLPESLSRGIILNWMRLFWNGARLVLAPSPTVRERLQKQGCRVPIEVWPTPIEDRQAEVTSSTLLQEELSLERPPFLYVGRLAFEKSLDFILRALARLKGEGLEAPWVLIGDGPARSSLEALAKELGLEKVYFLGWRAPQDLPNYYASALAFLFASQTETQGLVVAEAEMAGLPVVAIKASGVVEALPPMSPGLVNPGDLATFATKMEELWGDPQWAQRLGAQGRSFVQANLGLEPLLERYLQIVRPLSSE